MTTGSRPAGRLQDLGDREGPVGVAEHLHEGPTPARVALVKRREPHLDLYVQSIRLAVARGVGSRWAQCSSQWSSWAA